MSHPFATLTPDLVLDAVESLGYLSDARVLALNSYENRVYQVGIEDSAPLIAKFYRPDRWSDAAIREEHAFSHELAECEVPVVAPLQRDGGSLFEHAGFRFALFSRRGGRFVKGDARTLQQEEGGWRVATELGIVTAREAVVAMGPWSDLVFKPLGYRFPLGVKRGYHVHLTPRGNARLQHAVLDADRGYLLAPMNRGIRLTTGAEFARRDAPPSPVQIAQTLPVARALFPLGDTIEPQPWMGARPCLPDMLPLIGRAPRHPGLWFDFGHQHHGLTLGPVTGRLLAEMMTGEQPLTDPRPFSAERFG